MLNYPPGNRSDCKGPWAQGLLVLPDHGGPKERRGPCALGGTAAGPPLDPGPGPAGADRPSESSKAARPQEPSSSLGPGSCLRAP